MRSVPVVTGRRSYRRPWPPSSRSTESMHASATNPPVDTDAPGTPGRVVIVALCGGGDRPIAALGDRTPFEAAATPHLDALARAGRSGLLEIIAPDVPPESDSGAMALLGYDP